MKALLRPSRRQILVGGLGLGAMAAGGVYAATGEPYDFFNAMLRTELPGVKLSEATIRAYASDALKGRNPDFYVKFEVLLWMQQIIGYTGVVTVLAKSWAFEVFRRDMLTLFLMSTNFFELADPRMRELKYFGPPAACGNPFARFGRE